MKKPYIFFIFCAIAAFVVVFGDVERVFACTKGQEVYGSENYDPECERKAWEQKMRQEYDQGEERKKYDGYTKERDEATEKNNKALNTALTKIETDAKDAYNQKNKGKEIGNFSELAAKDPTAYQNAIKSKNDTRNTYQGEQKNIDNKYDKNMTTLAKEKQERENSPRYQDLQAEKNIIDARQTAHTTKKNAEEAVKDYNQMKKEFGPNPTEEQQKALDEQALYANTQTKLAEYAEQNQRTTSLEETHDKNMRMQQQSEQYFDKNGNLKEPKEKNRVAAAEALGLPKDMSINNIQEEFKKHKANTVESQNNLNKSKEKRTEKQNEWLDAAQKEFENETLKISKQTFNLTKISAHTQDKFSKTKGVRGVLENIIRFFIFAAGIVAVLGISIGGVMMMVGMGDETILQNGKNAIFYSVIGLVIVLLAYIMVSSVQSIVYGIAG